MIAKIGYLQFFMCVFGGLGFRITVFVCGFVFVANYIVARIATNGQRPTGDKSALAA